MVLFVSRDVQVRRSLYWEMRGGGGRALARRMLLGLFSCSVFLLTYRKWRSEDCETGISPTSSSCSLIANATLTPCADNRMGSLRLTDTTGDLQETITLLLHVDRWEVGLFFAVAWGTHGRRASEGKTPLP